jgi:hypothetical protein
MGFCVVLAVNGDYLLFAKRGYSLLCEISGSHGGEYEVQSLLGCTAM